MAQHTWVRISKTPVTVVDVEGGQPEIIENGGPTESYEGCDLCGEMLTRETETTECALAEART
jgi:hypothetical protein